MTDFNITRGQASFGGFRQIFAYNEVADSDSDGVDTYTWSWETPATVYDSMINTPTLYQLVYKLPNKKIKLLRSATSPAVYKTISTGGLGFIYEIYDKRLNRLVADYTDVALVNDSADLVNFHENYSFKCIFPCYEVGILAKHLTLVNAAALPNTRVALNLTTHSALLDGVIVIAENNDTTNPVIRFKQGVYS